MQSIFVSSFGYVFNTEKLYSKFCYVKHNEIVFFEKKLIYFWDTPSCLCELDPYALINMHTYTAIVNTL